MVTRHCGAVAVKNVANTTQIIPSKKPGKPQGAAAVQDLRLFERGIRNQAKIYVWQQERLIAAIRAVEMIVPDADRDRAVEDLINDRRDDLRDMGIFWARCAPAMIAAKKARKELLKLMPTEQLEAQLVTELAKAAKAFTDEEWQAMVAARATEGAKEP